MTWTDPHTWAVGEGLTAAKFNQFFRDNMLAIGPDRYGTLFPVSPFDGEEFTLVDDVANPSYAWRFRYNAGSSSSHKWEFVGGSPAQSFLGSGVGINTFTAYTDFNGPSILVPANGEFEVTIEGVFTAFGDDVATSAFLSYAIGATAPLDEDAARFGMKTTQEVLDLTQNATRRKTIAAGDVVEERIRISRSTGSTWTVQNRRLSILPVRVS